MKDLEIIHVPILPTDAEAEELVDQLFADAPRKSGRRKLKDPKESD